jgi:hypothetical protein
VNRFYVSLVVFILTFGFSAFYRLSDGGAPTWLVLPMIASMVMMFVYSSDAKKCPFRGDRV